MFSMHIFKYDGSLYDQIYLHLIQFTIYILNMYMFNLQD